LRDAVLFLMTLVAVEAVTEIVGESDLFEPLRDFLEPFPWIGGLLDCRYCLSVWVSVAGALCLRFTLVPGAEPWWIAADLAVKVFALHRFSNVLHEGIYRWIERMPFVVAVNPSNEEEKPADEKGAKDDPTDPRP